MLFDKAHFAPFATKFDILHSTLKKDARKVVWVARLRLTCTPPWKQINNECCFFIKFILNHIAPKFYTLHPSNKKYVSKVTCLCQVYINLALLWKQMQKWMIVLEEAYFAQFGTQVLHFASYTEKNTSGIVWGDMLTLNFPPWKLIKRWIMLFDKAHFAMFCTEFWHFAPYTEINTFCTVHRKRWKQNWLGGKLNYH